MVDFVDKIYREMGYYIADMLPVSPYHVTETDNRITRSSVEGSSIQS